jgi:hypothetical protein
MNKKSTAASRLNVTLSDHDLANLKKIKELTGIRTSPENIRRALGVMRCLLEKRADGHTICLKKGENVIDLEIIF